MPASSFGAAAVPTSAARATPSRGSHARKRLKRRELTFIYRNLATLIDNGIPLAKSLAALAQEKSLKRYAGLLDDVRRQVEIGTPFSTALGGFPATFDPVMVHQIRVGEKAGTLADTLGRVAAQLDTADRVRSQALRKLAYPAVLLGVGFLAVTFMLLFVIPVFETTYNEANVPLPLITRVLIGVAEWAKVYGWIVPAVLMGAIVTVRRLRRDPALGWRVDRWFLRLPLFGQWLTNLCVLQFMDVLGNLLESGFTVVEALSVSTGAIGNQAVRRSVEGLRAAVSRGERFSRELDKLNDLFPPVVSQLVVVGEKTGSLSKTTSQIRDHLRREIERETALLVGAIEPILTIGLAVMIGGVILAIYLPMFDMIGAMNARR